MKITVNTVVEFILYRKTESSILNADFSDWTYPTVNANTSVIILIATFSVGIVFIMSGLLRQYLKKNTQ